MSKKKKRKMSKISVFFVSLILTIIVIFTLFIFINYFKNLNTLKKINSEITIPKGFYYVGGEINTGIVISDNKNDEFKGIEYDKVNKLKGNQFVWVPVENAVANDFKEAEMLVKNNIFPIAIKDEDNLKALVYVFDTYNKKYLVVNQDDYHIEPYIVPDEIYGDSEEYIKGSTKGLYQETFNKMVKSVEKNKGFYISRYEIGNLTNAVKNNEKIVSKAGEDDITYMDWVNLYKICKNMYDREDITTEMIWGCQWNSTLLWIAQNINIRKYVFDSRNIGNYSNNKKKTASNREYVLNNIFDLAGNAYEWTQMGTVAGGRKAYGGYYGTTSKYYLDDNKMYPITYLWDEVGTRVTMYIN